MLRPRSPGDGDSIRGATQSAASVSVRYRCGRSTTDDRPAPGALLARQIAAHYSSNIFPHMMDYRLSSVVGCRTNVAVSFPSVPNTTIRHAALVLPDRVERAPLHIAGGRIAAAWPANAWELDLRDHLIFPGLINAHDHLHLNNIPPLPQSAPFPNSYAWIAAFQPHFADPRVAAAVAVAKPLRYQHGCLKNLLAGATTVAHHDPWHAALDAWVFPVGLLRDFGWSHSLGLGIENEEVRIENAENSHFSLLTSQLPRYGPPVLESFAATPAHRLWIIH